MNNNLVNAEVLPANSFFDDLIALNSLADRGFAQWAFYPCMVFGAKQKWWSPGSRGITHEGIDLCLFLDANGTLCRLDSGARIPAVYDGRVESVIDDFLGKTLFLRHDIRRSDGALLHSVYGHVRPCCAAGVQVKQGVALAAVSSKGSGAAGMLPHLHLSMAWISPTTRAGELNWKTLAASPSVCLIDPILALGLRHSIVHQQGN